MKNSYNVQEWDGQTIERYFMHQPISSANPFHALFTRRNEKKSQFPRFYLYSIDTEIIYLAAQYKSELGYTSNPFFHKYTISMDATIFSKKSKSFLGKLKRIGRKQVYSGISWHMQPDAKLREVIRLWNNSPNPSQISIPPLGIERLLVDLNSKESLPDQEVKFDVIKTSNSCLIRKDENLIFELVKIDNTTDEFQFTASYPLSIFQAFCIALVFLTD